ncbi:hypothetical protein [uncultured Alistipes sp.]|uniref:hypothetical protein n=1 Tax=uncultured Alistipes sp. TaxID=538949 RepID=UPI00260D33E3|nr:hypothetical protein [uncultured Alistipes sp.]
MQLPPVRTIQEICGEDHPNLLLTKFRFHAPRYWIETLFLRTLQQNLTATAPTAIVDANIKDDNGQHILIRRGTPVEISATIQKAKGVGKGAYIKLDFLSTRSVDGQLIRLQGNLIKEGQNRKGTALGVGLGVGLSVCWPCLFCLCIKGEKLTIPENTLVNNVVTNDVYQVNVN